MSHTIIKSIILQFEYYKSLADKCFNGLTDHQLIFTPNNESNSIAIIIHHLSGNMLSRWTNFLNSDGEKEWRNRDNEFEPIIYSKEELITLWNNGWDCLFNALNEIESTDQLDQIIYIRNEGHTVLEAILRQIAHYAYHIGQIVYLTKMIKDKEWQPLTIPRNKSGEYNKEKFSNEKTIRHFTQSELK